MITRDNKDPIKIMLREGQSYPFTCDGLVELADHMMYYLFLDLNGFKHLLPESQYRHYGFKKNQQVTCRVDKINCNGRVYIEPLHPLFREGELYDFSFIEYSEKQTSPGGLQVYMTVRDDGHHSYTLPVIGRVNRRSSGEKVTLKVMLIRKGKLFLTDLLAPGGHQELDTGQTYEFLVTGESDFGEKHVYFLLKGPYGDLHLLRKKYYIFYGLSEGRTVTCKVIGNPGTLHHLEPLHPFYGEGETYVFDVLGIEYIERYPEKKIVAAVIYDRMDHKYYIPLDEAGYLPKKPEKISCRVDGIYKGRLILTCSDADAGRLFLGMHTYQE
jgi:hypothetical protein